MENKLYAPVARGDLIARMPVPKLVCEVSYASGFAWFACVEGGKYPFQDDHLFVSHDLAHCVKSCHVLDNESTRGLSDHLPVVVDIRI
jgi:hypothetical protein